MAQLSKCPLTGRIPYLTFIDNTIGFGNKNHNPFKSLVAKIELFNQSNKLDPGSLLKRIGAVTSDGVTTEKFAEFLKQKVEKSRSLEELQSMAVLMDIDKDGYICENDLGTCIKHLDSDSFFKEGGKALQKPQFNAKDKFFSIDIKDQIKDEKLIEVCGQIRKAIDSRGYSHDLIFSGFDSDKDGMLTITEFSRGIVSLVPLSQRILQRLFALMDQNQIGMIDFEAFKKVLDIKVPSQIPRKADKVEDDFTWQQDIIKGIKRYVRGQGLTPTDAFRLFDQDFDGKISIEDMRNSVQTILGIPEAKITNHRLGRLMRLLSFYKTDSLQPSDFDRLLLDINPFLTACQGPVKANFKKAMGGGFLAASTHDWKL